MKNLFLSGIAALFLATMARAETPNATKQWQPGRSCDVWKLFVLHPDKSVGSLRIFEDESEAEVVSVQNDHANVSLRLHDVLELQKYLPMLKKCTAFWQCVEDRQAGKVKHCYENDRRWR